ncbi:mechanosensitive ion channel family protein [Calderihabitans maritimus]
MLTQIGVATAIFLGFWLLRKVFARYISQLLLKLSVKTKTDLDDQIVLAFEKPLQFFFILLGLYLSLSYLPLSSPHNLLLSKLFRSSIIILVSMGFYNLVGSYAVLCEEVEKVFGIQIDKILIPFLSKVLRVTVVALAISVVAQEWDYDVNGFIAGLGLGGLAFALAAKDTVSNIFGGIVIITDKPFSIGDWIYTPSVEGIVEDINFRSTKIRTFAQALVTVPNATLANEPITNWSRMGKRRITFKLGVTYNTSKDKLEKCVNEIKNMLENHPEIHKETIFVRFDSFGESSLDIFLYFFTKTTNWGEYLRVKEDVNFKIMEILEREGVSVAFPSTSVYFETPLETKSK